LTSLDPTIHPEPNELGTTAILASVTPVLIPSERYHSEPWAQREHDQLWPRVWQIACTTSQVPDPGDFFEFRCGDLSVIVVRGDDGTLRGFQNTCRHRGNSICQGGGSGLTELRCPYHRWAWDLEGQLQEVPSRKAFGPGLTNDNFGLFPVQVDTWGPLVFINGDLQAESLADYLEVVPDDIAWARPQDYECQTAVSIAVEANWKVVAEGFSETYHVQGIHREFLPTIDDVHAPQIIWDKHGVSYQRYGVPSPRQFPTARPSPT
jgi:choline monooxygenase